MSESRTNASRIKAGDRVRFNTESETGPDRRVVSVTRDGMLELHDMTGHFAPHLFVVVTDHELAWATYKPMSSPETSATTNYRWYLTDTNGKPLKSNVITAPADLTLREVEKLVRDEFKISICCDANSQSGST